VRTSIQHQHPLDNPAPNRPLSVVVPEVEDIWGAQNGVEGTLARDDAVTGACVGLLAVSPGNCRAISGLTEEEPAPADPPNPPEEFPVGMVMVGTIKGSELSPNAGAVAPMADVLDEEKTEVFDEENGVSVPPAAPAPDGVRPKPVDPKEPVVPNVGPACVGLADRITWACATSAAASHIIITKMNVRSIGLSFIWQSLDGISTREACGYATNAVGSVAFRTTSYCDL
jgi:hypothetical protein